MQNHSTQHRQTDETFWYLKCTSNGQTIDLTQKIPEHWWGKTINHEWFVNEYGMVITHEEIKSKQDLISKYSRLSHV